MLVYGTGTPHEKVLTKSIPPVHDLEDIILQFVRPRVMTRYAFLAITFISDIFLKFYSTKRGTKRKKICKKKIGHQTRLGENGLFSLRWVFDSRSPRCVIERVRYF